MPIYEGTNGIQSNDLVFRKVLRDDGLTAFNWIKLSSDQTKGFHPVLTQALQDLESTTKFIVANKTNLDGLAAIAVPYLKLFGIVAGGVMLARSVVACTNEVDAKFAGAKKQTAEFYMTHILTQSSGLGHVIAAGMTPVLVASDIL